MKRNGHSPSEPSCASGSYRLIEHTADIGVELYATSPDGLFAAAATSLPALVEHPAAGSTCTRNLRLAGASLEELLVGWYNELLFLLERDAFLTSSAETRLTGNNRLEARLFGQLLDRNEWVREVKSATWHQLEIRPSAEGWQARIYLDL